MAFGLAAIGIGKKLLGKGLSLLKRRAKKINIKGAVEAAKRGAQTPIGRRILRGGIIGGAVGAAEVARRRRRGRMGGMAFPDEAAGAGGAADRGFRRYRRMNPGNTRAMRRAIRRVKSGAKLYRQLFSITRRSVPGSGGVKLKGKRRAA